ncbi:MAG: putative lipid II flippase FtsW [Deltaproteobacteria bacterium]|nr:putative lipid II flippase FtsW [Deltaproteobacteria bacterium]
MSTPVVRSRRDSTSRSMAAMAREESRGHGGGRKGLPLCVWLVGAVAALVGIGIVLVYSSSSVFAARTYQDAEHFLRLQLGWAVLGLVGLWVATRTSAELLHRRAGLFLAVSLFLCAIVLIPGIGHLAGGARRWLTVAGVGFQPSEVAKVAVVLMMAAMLARRDSQSPEARQSLLVPVALAQVPVLLILAEPDLGTALVIEIIVGMMVFMAGLRLRTLGLIGLAALPVFYHLVVGTPFRLQRLLSFIDPWAYRSTIGYQVTEALISIGSGGVFGVGLGEGKHKLFFLPEAHTDFIFAILGEELGLVGVVALVGAFGIVIWRGLEAGRRAATGFDAYLAVGATMLLGVPAVFNLLVATGLLPTKGLPLPLISYGGSNLVLTLVALGLVMRVERDGRGVAAWEAAT